LGKGVAAALSMMAVHLLVAAGACRELAAAHLGDEGRGARWEVRSCGLQGLLAEFA
jgi:hypothetical protein